MGIAPAAMLAAGIGGAVSGKSQSTGNITMLGVVGQETGDKAIASAHGINNLGGNDSLTVNHTVFREDRSLSAPGNSHNLDPQAVAELL